MRTPTRHSPAPCILILILACTACDDSTSRAAEPTIDAACLACIDDTRDAGPSADATTDGGAGNAEAGIVVSVDWLRARLDDPDLQIIDTRAAGYADARIPGALLLTAQALVDPDDALAGQVATSQQARAALRAIGLRNGTTAVVYGAPPEYQAARAVWALRHHGHDARYLDGGLAAWTAAGGSTEDGPATAAEPTEYEPSTASDLRVTGDWVLGQLGPAPFEQPDVQLVDARSAAEWEAGHIPTAAQVNWVDNFADGLLLPRAALQPLYAQLDPSRTTITYCRTGQRGSAAWLVLTHLGFDDVRLYDGSWAEWGASANFPAETSTP